MNRLLLLLLIFCITGKVNADKIYRTYQDYLNGKAMAEGAINMHQCSAFVKGYKLKLKKSDGTFDTINVKGVWGFEQEENLDGIHKVTFLNRVDSNQVYRLLSKGKYNCWVLKTENPVFIKKAGIYLIKEYLDDAGVARDEPAGPPCFQSISINGPINKITPQNFYGEMRPEEKKQVQTEMAKYGFVRYIVYAMQYYNKLFPLN